MFQNTKETRQDQRNDSTDLNHVIRGKLKSRIKTIFQSNNYLVTSMESCNFNSTNNLGI